MNKDDVRKELKEVFIQCSLIDETENDITEVGKIGEGIDSFTYISIIVEIENRFDIEIPDEYLVTNLLSSIDSLCEMILGLSAK